MARLDRELAEVRARGVKEGEEAKAALLQRAEEEAERVRREAQEEIARRLAFATEELRRTAADLTAAAAIEKVSAEYREDRRRLLSIPSAACRALRLLLRSYAQAFLDAPLPAMTWAIPRGGRDPRAGNVPGHPAESFLRVSGRSGGCQEDGPGGACREGGRG